MCKPGEFARDLPLPEKCAASLLSPQTWRQQTSSRAERLYEAHQAEREDRYRQIAALCGQGMTHTAIAQRVGVSPYKLRSWLKQEGAPVHRRPQEHESLFDPCASYALDRWRAGVQDGKQWYEVIRQQGYSGSLRLVRLVLQPLREQRKIPEDLVPSSPVEQFCARDTVWRRYRKMTSAFVVFSRARSAYCSIGVPHPSSCSVCLGDTLLGVHQFIRFWTHKRKGEIRREQGLACPASLVKSR